MRPTPDTGSRDNTVTLSRVQNCFNYVKQDNCCEISEELLKSVNAPVGEEYVSIQSTFGHFARKDLRGTVTFCTTGVGLLTTGSKDSREKKTDGKYSCVVMRRAFIHQR